MAHEQLARSITKDGDRVIEINEGIAREDKLKRSVASLQGWCRRYRRDIRELTYAIDTRY